MKRNPSRFASVILLVAFVAIFIECSEKREPVSVSTHPAGWLDETSPNFHGKVILQESLSLKSCQACHGEDYQGGEVKIACATCHELFPHQQGFADSLSPNFHAVFIATQLSWNISECRSCHGADYAGENYPQKNCLTCHTQPEGPEACNTCHGSSQNFAPPKDLQGNTDTSAPGVGAHQPHLTDTTWTSAFTRDCQLCHRMPQRYGDPMHVLEDDTPGEADISFGDVATDSGKVAARWNRATLTCENIYCHGAFRFSKNESANQWAYADSVITGNNPALVWNSVGTGQADCGSCHDLPPKGHIAATTCNGCHPRVVDANNNIIDRTLHINGKIEVF